jgi:CDP-diacylglycerol--glycerol-3-phosphate 3-phosphatidyltransferase
MKPFPGERLQNLLSHPNALTLYRIAVVPLIVVLMLFPNRFCTALAALLFSAAAITDFLDGFYARSRGLESTFGRIMDPLADKLLVSSTLIMLAYYQWVPAWMVCIIVGREIAVTGLRNFISENSKDVSSSVLGKYKTGFQIAALIPLLFHFSYFGVDLHAIGTLYIWVALALTIWSGMDYFIRNRALLVS